MTIFARSSIRSNAAELDPPWALRMNPFKRRRRTGIDPGDPKYEVKDLLGASTWIVQLPEHDAPVP